ncbi:MAG: glycerol-3-phosphate 1-O-acyltransferase PlsY [Syntrophomonadaceae bacterium]|nr:glycerol-3-phosphate 1-O-acyltransferase PlsY [Syntrophomonadaceae bacterium]
MKELLLVIVCYLIGSIPFSYIVSRLLGKVDIRKTGSGNVGATNVLRSAGLVPALLAVTGDILKGVFAAWLATVLGGGILLLLCPLAAVVGHCYPVYLGFRGGKGVATSTGALLFLTPYSILCLFFAFVIVVGLSRIVSLGSLTAAVFIPFVTLFLYPRQPFVIILTFLLAILVIYRHKDNIKRLREGREPRIGERV